MSMLRAFDYIIQVGASDAELPCYACVENAMIESIIFSNEKDVPDSNINYTELAVIDKGLDGLGNTVINYITNNPDDVEHYVELSSYKAHTLLINYDVTKGHVLSFKKTDFGAGADLGFTNIVVNERRY